MFTVGADPELFVENEKGILSAFGMVPGTKNKPHVVEGFGLQVDGMALEYATPPANNENEFITYINKGRELLAGYLHPGQTFSENSHWEVDLTQHVDEEVELGCDPDYSAYTKSLNEPPNKYLPMRTVAGHIHIGWRDPEIIDDVHFDRCCMIAKSMDVMLGVPSVVMDQGGEQRRKLYGKAGAFRPKPYGLEYRVLSNFWLKSDRFMSWVYKNSVEAAKRHKELLPLAPSAQVFINNNAVRDAERFVEEFNVPIA